MERLEQLRSTKSKSIASIETTHISQRITTQIDISKKYHRAKSTLQTCLRKTKLPLNSSKFTSNMKTQVSTFPPSATTQHSSSVTRKPSRNIKVPTHRATNELILHHDYLPSVLDSGEMKGFLGTPSTTVLQPSSILNLSQQIRNELEEDFEKGFDSAILKFRQIFVFYFKRGRRKSHGVHSSSRHQSKRSRSIGVQ